MPQQPLVYSQKQPNTKLLQQHLNLGLNRHVVTAGMTSYHFDQISSSCNSPSAIGRIFWLKQCDTFGHQFNRTAAT
jgi:hypothetical protein